jgi:hypothetical protein
LAFWKTGWKMVRSATSVIVTLSPHCCAVALTVVIDMVCPTGGTPSVSGANGRGMRL